MSRVQALKLDKSKWQQMAFLQAFAFGPPKDKSLTAQSYWTNEVLKEQERQTPRLEPKPEEKKKEAPKCKNSWQTVSALMRAFGG